MFEDMRQGACPGMMQSCCCPQHSSRRVVVQAACVQFYKRFIECPNFMAWFERRRGAAAAWQVHHCCANLIPCFCLLLIKTAVWLCAATHAGRCMEVLLANSAERQVMPCSCPVGAGCSLNHCFSAADVHLAVQPHCQHMFWHPTESICPSIMEPTVDSSTAC